jgi:hypothetical protein
MDEFPMLGEFSKLAGPSDQTLMISRRRHKPVFAAKGFLNVGFHEFSGMSRAPDIAIAVSLNPHLSD